MNRRMVFFTVGLITCCEAVLMLLPLIVSLIYQEQCVVSFAISIGIALLIGVPLMLICKPKSHVIYAKEGFVTVALAWIILSIIGAFPFVISKEIPSFVNAFFETVSGFTTTGASIVENVELMSHGILFWRSFTHWIGGMGVLVFIVAIMPNVSDRSIHILRAEMPGPIMGKLVPKIKETAKILYLIYIAMTVVEIIMLICGGMPVFDSLIHSFGTAGTGGFGMKADSVEGYSSYLQWVIGIFMMLFGINFNLFYLCIIGRIRSVLKSEELWGYFGIIAASAAVICANILPIYKNFSKALRLSFFQVSSIMTTTGFSTADFDSWPELSKGILLLLMFIGACAGSTGGGIKVSRIVLLFKNIKREIKRLIHPRLVSTVRFEGKNIDDATINGVNNYLALYLFCFLAIFLVLCVESNLSFETNFSAVAACFNNIGPGFNLVGPASNYSAYSALSKITLSFAMLLGRLELFPIIIAFAPSTWTKK